MVRLTLDFETRSCVDIKKRGASVYSEDPSTEVLCLAIYQEGLPPFILTPPMERHAPAIARLLKEADTLEAHNAFFEASIWQNICVPRYGWPSLPPQKLRCSLAKASMHAIPRSLEQAGEALGLRQLKWKEGYAVMMKLCRPRKPKKDEDPDQIYWNDDSADFEKLYKYCIQDTISEELLSQSLSDLPPKEQALWELDQIINHRGIQADLDSARVMIKMISEHEEKLLARLKILTHGSVKTAKQVENMRNFLRGLGLDLPDLTAKTVKEALLREDLTVEIREILEIRRSLGRSSSAKYQSILDRASADGRVRGSVLYHGAATGRWCMPWDAEVLTLQGWIRLDRWDDRGPIVCWDTKKLSFMKAVKKSFICDNEQMITISNRFLAGKFTTEHRIPYFTSRSKLKVCIASDLGKSRCDLPTAGILVGTYTSKNDALLRVIVMAQADGHFCTNKSEGRMLRFHFKRIRKIQRAQELLRVAAIPFTLAMYGENAVIRIKWADIPSELMQAKNFAAWLLRYSPEVFIDELKYWDGSQDVINSKEGVDYSTTSYDNADWVATMAHLAGFSATITKRVREKEAWKTSWRVYIRARQKARLEKSAVGKSNFTGRVYCPVTPTGFFLVRYDGKIHITGNSGSGIQPQNFPSRIPISDDPETMLKVIQLGGLELHNALYDDDPMSTAGALTRSILTASEGKELIVADYSAIEGRGLAWLADEDSELDVYRSGKDPYIASAANILHKKYEDVTKQERQSPGKISVLACIVEGSLVLTDQGLAPIEKVLLDMRVWDGVEWVNHGGVVFRGIQEVIEYDGLQATPDHVVFTEAGEAIGLREAAGSQQRLAQTGLGGTPVWYGEDNFSGHSNDERASADFVSVSRLQSCEMDRYGKPTVGEDGGLPTVQSAVSYSGMASEAFNGGERSLPKSERSGVQELRSPRDRISISVGDRGGAMGDKKLRASEKCGDRSERKQRPLRTGESPLGNAISELQQHAEFGKNVSDVSQVSGTASRDSVRRQYAAESDQSGVLVRADNPAVQCALVQTPRPVWDILNCGPRNRFTVSGKLVHNCGYGGSAGAVRKFGGEGLSDDEIKAQIVQPWREAHPMTVTFWYKLEEAAFSAVEHPGNIFSVGRIQYRRKGKFLQCRLPSGRILYYYDPDIRLVETPWSEGEKIKESVTYMTVDSMTKKWIRTKTFGGKLSENVTQAICRDIMAEAMLRVEKAGYPVVMTVHDEIICEVPEWFGSITEFERIMCVVPEWAGGFPITASGWRGKRYRK